MKRVLITGFTGMVGSHLADFILEETDWQVFGLLLLERQNRKH